MRSKYFYYIYNQIWLGSDDSILLVADGVNEHNHQVYHIVALQMTDMVDDQGKVCWNIHTAQSRKSRSGKNLLLWKKC